MENTTMQTKSNAPWILGIVGFILSIPNVLCATLCAAVGAGIAMEAEAAGSADAESAAAGMAGLLLGVIIASLLCFIFSFLGKSKNSHIFGILVVLGAAFILVTALIGFGSWFWGIAAGVLYLIGGIFSILNKKRI